MSLLSGVVTLFGLIFLSDVFSPGHVIDFDNIFAALEAENLHHVASGHWKLFLQCSDLLLSRKLSSVFESLQCTPADEEDLISQKNSEADPWSADCG